jgi:TonB family protein
MKRKIYIFLFTCLLNTPAVLAQNSDTTSAPAATTPPEEEIHKFVEERAQFPGGHEAMISYLKNNVKYPKKDRKEKLEGRVMATFTVLSTGVIKDIKILRGVSPTIDAEVIRVIGSMPKWNPAVLHGKPVSSMYSLPVVFEIP